MNTKLTKTTDGILALTKAILAGTAAAAQGQQSYLQSLVLGTQAELGVAPRKRAAAGRRPRLDEAGIKGQLKALDTVHERFYEAVLTACREIAPRGDAKELNRLSNFARTALYSVRLFIRAGNDLSALAAERVTKESLRVTRPPRELTPRRLKGLAERQSKQLVSTLLALSETDREAAAAEFELLMGQLAHIAEEAGFTIEAAEAPRAPQARAAPSRPIGVPGPFHVRPTETLVERQRARPS